MTIPNLNEIVEQSLSFFESNALAFLNLKDYHFPFVIGSGNALNTGKIIFSKQAVVFADESNFKSLIKSYLPAIQKNLIKQAVIISASGEKDSVWETELANKNHLHTTLLTCNQNSLAAQIADKTVSFKSIAEPYTYNTSTYLGMIISTTKENPKKIKKYIKKIKLPKNFKQYKSYAFILPDEYINIAPMINIKGDELFGPHLMIRACTYGNARHAKFVHPWDKELVISLGKQNNFFGHPNHRWDLKLPKFSSLGTVMALSYYICGKIQAVKPQYFKKNIKNFCLDYGPKAYGKDQKFEIIVQPN